MIRFLDLHAQYREIQSEIDDAIASVIRESAYIGGPFVKAFEEEFACYQQAQFCVGVGNGTDALEIIIEALNLPEGSEIIVPANSFIATAEAVIRSGHRIKFCDVDPNTFAISIDALARAASPQTAAIIPVHQYGRPCDIRAIVDVAVSFGAYVIEDCAQAHGAEFGDARVGTFGVASAFSFYPGKNLGAYGDGGAILTNDEELALRCRMLANHGRKSKYDHEFVGRNSRLDGIQAAILSVKLKYLDSWIDHRNRIADIYREHIGRDENFTIQEPVSSGRHAYHLFVLRHSERDSLRAFLERAGVQTGIHYPIALPALAAFTSLQQESLSANAVRMANEVISLPIGEHLKEREALEVAELVSSYA